LAAAAERLEQAGRFEGRAQITQTVQVNLPRGATLFTADQPSSANVAATVEMNERPGIVWLDLRRASSDAPLPEERLSAETHAFVTEVRDAVAELGLRSPGPGVAPVPADAVSRVNAKLGSRPDIVSIYLDGDYVSAVTVRAPALAQYADVGVLRADSGTYRGMSYTTTSWVSVADATPLPPAPIHHPASPLQPT